MAEKSQIQVKIFINDDQLIALQETAKSTFQTFRDGFEYIGRTSDSVFFKFNGRLEQSLKQTESTFDKIYKANNSTDQLVRQTAIDSGIQAIFDQADAIANFITDFYDSITNRSVVRDAKNQTLPNIESLLSSQTQEPIKVDFNELARIASEKQDKQIQGQAKTIEELVQLVADMLQKDLSVEFGETGIQIPELKIEIPKLDVQVPEDVQPEHLKDILGPSISSQIQGASADQIKSLAILHSALNNIIDQYNEARKSILSQSTVIQDSNGVIDANTKAIADNGAQILDNANATKSASDTTRMSMEIVGATGEKVLGLAGNISNLNDTLNTATKGQGIYSKSIEDVIENTNEGALIFGYTKEELLGLRDATDNAAKSAENLGENGLTVASEKAGQAGNSLVALDGNLLNVAERNKDVADLQERVNQVVGDGSDVYDDASESAENYGDTLEQVQNQGGFFEGIKQGFKDFVTNVESNSELMADFFANTLSQMSQSFSDLFFNVLTGKFDDLADLAKQAFEAILRAFLDLVAAIVTKQIVISIAGTLGVDTKAASAGDLLGIGQNAAESAVSAGTEAATTGKEEYSLAA